MNKATFCWLSHLRLHHQYRWISPKLLIKVPRACLASALLWIIQIFVSSLPPWLFNGEMTSPAPTFQFLMSLTQPRLIIVIFFHYAPTPRRRADIYLKWHPNFFFPYLPVYWLNYACCLHVGASSSSHCYLFIEPHVCLCLSLHLRLAFQMCEKTPITTPTFPLETHAHVCTKIDIFLWFISPTFILRKYINVKNLFKVLHT